MSQPNSYHTLPLHIGDLMRDTAHLSHDQFGAYMRLVFVHFNLGEAGIPKARLHHYARVSVAVWLRKYETVLSPLFDRAGDNVVLSRLVVTLHELSTRDSNHHRATVSCMDVFWPRSRVLCGGRNGLTRIASR